MNENADVHALAGAYALNALPADERAFFERHLAVCEACSNEVAELSETASRLGNAAAAQPPPDLRARILTAADVTRQLPPEQAPVVAPRGWQHLRGRLLVGVAACLALAVVGLTGINVNLNSQLREEQVARADSDRVAAVLGSSDLKTVELPMNAGAPERFLFSPAQDEGVLVASGLSDPGSNKTYELWLIHDGTPVPAGLFRPNADGSAVAAIDGIVRGAEKVAITIEPAGGSKQPTGSIVASADL
jgi:anti-sigma-K factor RskA